MLAIHIPIFFRLYFDNTLTWMRFEVMHIFQNWSFTPICYVHPVLLLFFFFFFFKPEPAIYFSLWEWWLSSLHCNLSAFPTCLLFIYFLHSFKSYPSFMAWLDFLRTFSASVDLYPQIALCLRRLLRFSYFAFFFFCTVLPLFHFILLPLIWAANILMIFTGEVIFG